MNRGPEYWISLTMDFLPVIPISVAWVQVVRSSRSLTRTSGLLLLTASVSVLWLGIGLFIPNVLGISSDPVGFLVINGNFVVMTIAAGMAIGKMNCGRIATTIGCFMLAFCMEPLVTR